MSQTPSFLQNLPDKLSQPTSIAVMASVGIHAVLGLALPPLLSRAEPKSSGNVQLLELTPLEVSRLPDSTPSLDGLPPLPSQPEPLSLSSLPLFPLPPYNPNPLPTPVAPPDSSSNPLGYSVSSIPIDGGYSLDEIQKARRSRALRYSPGKKTAIVDSPYNNLRGAKQPSTPLPALGGSESNTPPAYTPRSSGLDPSAVREFDNEEWVRELEQQQQQQALKPAPDYLDDNNMSPPDSLPPESSIDVAARHREQKEQTRAILLEEIRQRQQSIAYNPENTSDEDANRNLISSLDSDSAKESLPEEVRLEAFELKPSGALKIVGSYPKDACIKKLEGTSTHLVVLNAEGKVTQSQLIKSAGYPIFNQQASQEISSRSFTNPTGKLKPYLVNVTFNYNQENCPPVSVFEDAEEAQAPTTEDLPQQDPTAQESTESEAPTPPTSEQVEEAPSKKPTSQESGEREVTIPAEPVLEDDDSPEKPTSSESGEREVTIPAEPVLENDDSPEKPTSSESGERESPSTETEPSQKKPAPLEPSESQETELLEPPTTQKKPTSQETQERESSSTEPETEESLVKESNTRELPVFGTPAYKRQ